MLVQGIGRGKIQGGGTLLLNSTLNKKFAKSGTVVHPFRGQVLRFDGSLLHGVLPYFKRKDNFTKILASADVGTPHETHFRTSLNLGFWTSPCQYKGGRVCVPRHHMGKKHAWETDGSPLSLISEATLSKLVNVTRSSYHLVGKNISPIWKLAKLGEKRTKPRKRKKRKHFQAKDDL